MTEKEYQHDYYRRHREQRQAYFREYYRRNKEKIKERNKQKYIDKKDERSAKYKKYYEEHRKERLKYSKCMVTKIVPNKKRKTRQQLKKECTQDTV